MSKTAWKQRERDAAEMIGGKRYPANTGGGIDVENDRFVVQVKERKRLSITDFERFATDIAKEGKAKDKFGIVMAKRSAGKGNQTPWLVVMTYDEFSRLSGASLNGNIDPTGGHPVQSEDSIPSVQ